MLGNELPPRSCGVPSSVPPGAHHHHLGHGIRPGSVSRGRPGSSPGVRAKLRPADSAWCPGRPWWLHAACSSEGHPTCCHMPPAGFTGPTAGYQTNHLPALGTPLCPGPCRSHRPRWCSTPTSLNPGPARGHHTAGCQCSARRPGRFSGTQQGDGRCVNPSLGCVCWGKKGQTPSTHPRAFTQNT